MTNPRFGQEEVERFATAPWYLEFDSLVFDMARAWVRHSDIHFDEDVLPHLHDSEWWRAQYSLDEAGRQSMAQADALRCLVDSYRTYKLAQGIRHTVEHIRKTDPEKPITAIDAGTGTGILSVILASCGVNRVTAIELNPKTAATTSSFIEEVGLSNVIKVVNDDATQAKLYLHPPEDVDILVSENLSSGLTDEPQYQIISHLSPYLRPDAHIIPYKASVKASVQYTDWSSIPDTIYPLYATGPLNIGPTYNQTAEYIATITSEVGMKAPRVQGQSAIQVGGVVESTLNTVCLSTRFQMNRVGPPRFIESGTARFLGSATAFQCDPLEDIEAGEVVTVQLDYAAGCRKRDIRTTSNGRTILMTDS